MSARSGCVAVCVLVVGCAGAPEAGNDESGENVEQSVILGGTLGGVDLSDPCTTQAADAVHTFSLWANGYAQTTSTAYASRACSGLIIEVNGLATLVAYGTRDIVTAAVRPTISPASKAACEATSTNVTGYGYLPSTGRWERFGYATISGAWSWGSCTSTVKLTSGWPAANRYTKARFVARAKQTTSGWLTLTSVVPVQIETVPGRTAW